MDFIAPLVPIGLAAGRLGNFINGELPGRPTDLPWGMWFPQDDAQRLARHPSQLYQFALEGVLLFVILWIYSSKPRPAGAVSGAFLVGYGSFRFIAEFARAARRLPRIARLRAIDGPVALAADDRRRHRDDGLGLPKINGSDSN